MRLRLAEELREEHVERTQGVDRSRGRFTSWRPQCETETQQNSTEFLSDNSMEVR